ncbi:OprO/OprP family phosphate-selective porin [Rehaibacterium terrae]|jgi:phosphate-selective porin OprO/OprP|uniref:Phosphate-selective porin n=1 Tax=Rehaibacterium terrae TaxID=1341696 RepID=A0A7W7Y038_9GAMM|nr:porin [Rehaibacterium terrae]MBB5015623.1 phosphate-selective porin [Rehaibacterium terrae]
MSHPRLLATACLLGLGLLIPAQAEAGDALRLGVFAQYDLLRFDEAPAPLDDASFWRRGRVSLGGKFANGMDWKVEYDFVPDAWTDVYLRLPLAGGRLWLGQFKQPLGQEALLSDKAALFTESSVSGAFAPGRRLGVQYVRSQPWGTLAVSAYGRDIHDAGPDAGLGARWYRGFGDGASGLLHIGAAAAVEQPSSASLRLRVRPETGPKGGSWLSTGNLPLDRQTRYGLEAGWQHDRLLLQGEWLGSRFDAPGGNHSSGDGGYLAAAWTLRGAPRVYKDGLFGTPEPGQSLLGAVELVARYSRLDLPLAGGGRTGQDAWTLGLNAQIGKYWRAMLDYTAAEDRSGRDATGWTLRAQFAF